MHSLLVRGRTRVETRLPGLYYILPSELFFCWMRPNMTLYRLEGALSFLGPKLDKSEFYYLTQATWWELYKAFGLQCSLAAPHATASTQRPRISVFSPKFLRVPPGLWKTIPEAGNKKSDCFQYLLISAILKSLLASDLKSAIDYKYKLQVQPQQYETIKLLELFIHLLNI